MRARLRNALAAVLMKEREWALAFLLLLILLSGRSVSLSRAHRTPWPHRLSAHRHRRTPSYRRVLRGRQACGRPALHPTCICAPLHTGAFRRRPLRVLLRTASTRLVLIHTSRLPTPQSCKRRHDSHTHCPRTLHNAAQWMPDTRASTIGGLAVHTARLDLPSAHAHCCCLLQRASSQHAHVGRLSVSWIGRCRRRRGECGERL